VDSTFKWMNVDSEECRLRAVCQLQKSAAGKPVLAAVLKNLE
jgi:hypothetical protein